MYVVKLKRLSDWVFLTGFNISPNKFESEIRSEESINLSIQKVDKELFHLIH